MGFAKFVINKFVKISACMLLCMASTAPVWASTGAHVFLEHSNTRTFSQIYEPDLGRMRPCEGSTKHDFSFCFDALRNAGNAPFILSPKSAVKAVIVLFHGLSDSPFFMRSIAEYLQKQGYLVIAPLTPGHGLKQADIDMQDENMQVRWYKHIDNVMSYAESFTLPIIIGGFSTGGTFATYYTLQHPDKVDALLLFSGALELNGGAETMSNIWGIKTLASILDGKYETHGAHPYKYPSVASYSGLVLLDIIKEIRVILEDKIVDKPIFAAHSLADRVTLIDGIEFLTEKIRGNHTIFKIDKDYDVCHADVPMSTVQIINLKFNKSKVNRSSRCAVPKANPVHETMLFMLNNFLNEHVLPVNNKVTN